MHMHAWSAIWTSKNIKLKTAQSVIAKVQNFEDAMSLFK